MKSKIGNSILKEETWITAVDILNESNIKNSWREYIFSVDTIEEKRGFDFLANLKNDIESAYKAKKAPRN